MDIISFNEASTANSRIESFIENPDSTSGIVTVPKVIASGETITIPAGRVAVLPNVQVDGTLNISGEVFVPSGATFGNLEDQLALKAPLSSPAFIGDPTAPTPTAGDNSTKLATTAYVDGKMVLATAVTASGTAIDFTNIPSWAKRITVMFNGVSTSGVSGLLIQLGDSSGVQNTGYISHSRYFLETSTNGTASTNGIFIDALLAASIISGSVSIINISGNSFIATGTVQKSTAASNTIQGSKTLSGILDRIRITTVNGTDTFDAGQINIMYEG